MNYFFKMKIVLLVFIFNDIAIITAKQIIQNLDEYENTIYSQSGEDGIIDKLFQIVGTDSKYYVEFGAGDGHLISNTKALRELYGWNGLLLDCAYEDKNLNLHKEFITAENINDLFVKYKVPENLDLLSIDIDGNDFYVWKNIDSKYKPKVIVVEYNHQYKLDDKVVIYNPDARFDGTDYYGASLKAFYLLGRFKGYSLVHVLKNGVNLFFVRNDILEKISTEFSNVNNLEKLYVNLPRGHKADPLNRKHVLAASLLK